MLKALWMGSVDGLIDNDEKVVSSKKHTQFKTRVQKPYPIYHQKGQNRYPIYDQNEVSLAWAVLVTPTEARVYF